MDEARDANRAGQNCHSSSQLDTTAIKIRQGRPRTECMLAANGKAKHQTRRAQLTAGS